MAAATRACESAAVVTQFGPKPLHVMNGRILHGCQSQSRKTTAPKERGRRGDAASSSSSSPAVIRGSAAGEVGNPAVPDGFKANGFIAGNAGAPPRQLRHLSHTGPGRNSSAPRKNRRKTRKSGHKMRSPDPSQLPPREQEDWESEIQDNSLHNWEQICFGFSAYGPEDLLQFSLQDLSLGRRNPPDPSVAYSPSLYHPLPVRWSEKRVHAEPDQFADASE